MTSSRAVAAVAVAAMTMFASGSAGSREASVRPLASFPRERIAVDTRSARHHVLEAWRADTEETRAQGLMFVRDMRRDQAMIFVYSPPQLVGMWMKNTIIPLDMLFVDDAGCVVMLHEHAEPGSLDPIQADVPVALVVELVAGTAKELGIAPGDRVQRPDAAWPRGPRACTGGR